RDRNVTGVQTCALPILDPDVKAFAQFIARYLSANNRWNSPKYLYGESYGTLRSEVLADYLARRDSIDLNGIVLQSAYMGSAIKRSEERRVGKEGKAGRE